LEILLLDIETAPMLADVWSLWNNNVSLNQLRDPGGLLSFASKWLGEDEQDIRFMSDHKNGREMMLGVVHAQLTLADAVVTWNGDKFDLPILNSEFIQAGLKPPAPYASIDLLKTAKKRFRFPSNKLQYVSTALGFKGKVSHEGHDLWVKCMDGDEDAWAQMEVYNRQDVQLLDDLYWKFQPWIMQHPSRAVYADAHVCPKCGSEHLQRRGESRTLQSVFQRYQCQSCGGWSRSTRRESGVQLREVANG
jgi:predicted RNA-binding Zn-ribbon protein involved in translation (DUF1610 family)